MEDHVKTSRRDKAFKCWKFVRIIKKFNNDDLLYCPKYNNGHLFPFMLVLSFDELLMIHPGGGT